MSVALSVKNLVKHFGDFCALNNISFDIQPSQFVTLLGPSGCGKTTLLRTIAGFIEPDSGEICYDGRLMNDVPPNKRNTAMCFQSYALFPHKNVYENIRFGLRMHKVPPAEQEKRIKDAMELVNLGGLAERKPYELSGGQQQRVALARAIVVQPDILLFDEPLSNLDAKLREKVRVEIREIQQRLGITAVYVTHDQAEALAISDVIISMNQGTIQQIAGPREIYDNPRKRFVADFIGNANHIPGKILSRENGIALLDTDLGQLRSTDVVENVSGPGADICWRPEDLILLAGDEHPEGMNIIEGTVTHSVYMGNMIDVFFQCGERVFRANVDKDRTAPEGSHIRFALAYGKLHVMEAEAS